MQKNTHKNADFFRDFRYAQIQKYLFSGGIAVFTAFSVVSLIHADIDPRWLMASVAGVTEAPRYDADLVMTREDNSLIVTFGTRAQAVDTVDLTLLGDPSRLHSITSTHPDIRIVGQSEMGVYHVSIDMHGRDIAVGTRIARLFVSIDPGAQVVISDTELMSGGVRYSLSNKGE